ncbi:MAG: response regulator [Gemmatimonadetes bacterium]|nr:response regulator [Gemmatimonadota bacterium]
MTVPSNVPTIASTNGPSNRTVLLVDDHEGNISTFLDYLEAKGLHVIVARDGIEALSRCHETPPALILMDVQMPRLDGLSVTRELRKEPAFADTPIIALTALAMPGDRERCMEAGVNEYFAKPASLKAVHAAILKYLGPEPTVAA